MLDNFWDLEGQELISTKLRWWAPRLLAWRTMIELYVIKIDQHISYQIAVIQISFIKKGKKLGEKHQFEMWVLFISVRDVIHAQGEGKTPHKSLERQCIQFCWFSAVFFFWQQKAAQTWSGPIDSSSTNSFELSLILTHPCCQLESHQTESITSAPHKQPQTNWLTASWYDIITGSKTLPSYSSTADAGGTGGNITRHIEQYQRHWCSCIITVYPL